MRRLKDGGIGGGPLVAVRRLAKTRAEWLVGAYGIEDPSVAEALAEDLAQEFLHVMDGYECILLGLVGKSGEEIRTNAPGYVLDALEWFGLRAIERAINWRKLPKSVTKINGPKLKPLKMRGVV